MIEKNLNQLCGKTLSHLATSGAYAGVLHQTVIQPLEQLTAQAADQGFDLRIVSGFRSFERQLRIWNGKATGDRDLLNNDSEVVDVSRLSELELTHAILRWSALPGASRHHWGTDFDVYDAAAVSEDYVVQLTPEETQGSGPFARMHRWLDAVLPTTDFYRPYDEDRGGVAPEPWHLSYRPLADQYAKQLSPATVLCALKQGELLVGERIKVALHDCVSENIKDIYDRFIMSA